MILVKSFKYLSSLLFCKRDLCFIDLRSCFSKGGCLDNKIAILLLFVYTKHTIFLAILGQHQHMPLNTNTRTTGKLKLKNRS